MEMKVIYETTKTCRICGSGHLEELLNLGDQPPANSLYDPEDSTPPLVPLRLMFCKECTTVQIGESVNPQYLFSKYIWVTGTSKTAVEHSHYFFKKALIKSRNSTNRRSGVCQNPVKKIIYWMLASALASCVALPPTSM